MKKIIAIVVLLVGLGAAGWFVYERMHKEMPAVQYTCPMHPQVVQDKPGNCPICGMKLVPMENNEEHKEHKHPEGVYRVSPERRELIGVKTEVVETKELKREIRVAGRVAYDQELYITEQEYVNGLMANAEREVLEAIEKKLTRLALSEKELKKLKMTKKGDDSLVFPKEKGPFWIYANIYEADLSWVDTKMTAMISLPKDKAVFWEGEIKAISPVVDPMTRTALARIFVSTPKVSIKPETYVDVILRKDLGMALAVPADAVIETGSKQIVLVDLGEGFIEPREVKLGTKAAKDFPVVEGLSEGDVVITSAHFLLDSEAELQAAMKRFGEMPAGHQH